MNGSLAALTFALAASFAPAGRTAVPDTSSWKCERCPFASGYQAELAAGSTYVSDDSAVVGDATGYDDQGGYANVDGAGQYAGAAHRLSWRMEDLGLDSRVLAVEGARPGSLDYHLSYAELPRHRYDTTRSIFIRDADNRLTLPSAWTFAGTTAGFADLAASLAPRDIESERRTIGIGGRYLPARRWRLFAEYQRQERDGTDILGGSYFTNSSLLPHHFDYQTDQVDAGIRYDADRGYLKLAYYGSFFRDRFEAARWQSPFVTLPGAEEGAIAEAPDSDFQQLMLSGSYRFSRYDTRATFSGAVGRGKQNDPLLPYTTNASLMTGALPAPSLDGQVDTTNLALTVTASPLPRTRVKFAVRYDERDNRTAQLPWTRVIADSFLSGETELNLPYGFERLRTNFSAEYRLTDALGLSAGYDYLEIDRTFQEVAEQTEDTGWGRVQWRPVPWVDVSARGGISKRNADNYDLARAADAGQNPLMRKFNLAYRYRKFAEVSASVSPPEWPVSISTRASYADDRYSDSTVGLLAGDELRVSADLSWSVSDKASVYVTGGYDDTDTKQAGSAAFAAPDWQAGQSDTFRSIGGGLRIAGIGDHADLLLDYTRARGKTAIDVTGGAGPSRFPDLESTLDSLRIRVDYRWSTKLETTLQLRYENFPTEDWALQDVGPDALPTILTLGARPYDEEVWMAGISFRYLLGDR